MEKLGKKGLALLLCAGLGASMLTGCGKKAEAAAMFTYNGEAVDNNVATFLFRLQEASFDTSYGNMFAQYYGSANVWDMDLTGQGSTYGETFKDEFKKTMEKLLVAQDHAADYKITLSDAEEKSIADAADKFIAANSEKTLEDMSATRDVVIKALEMKTIQKKVEDEVGKTADTEVSDEEAAQRKVSYISYTPTTETESESEGLSEAGTEADAQNTTEADSTVTPTAAEAETAVETEKSEKTKSAASETEAKAAEASTEAATTEALTESETETESPEMQAALRKYKAMAEEELEKIKDSGREFSEYMDEVSKEKVAGVTASSMTFGKNDSYPASEIIKATNDLEDNTLVDHLVEANNNYYILYVNEKLDKDATESKKKQIIEERKQTAVDDQYTEWEKDVKFETDSDAFGKLTFDRAYTAPASADTEAAAAGTESAGTESYGTEAGAVQGTEAENGQTETAAVEAAGN